MEEPYLPEDSSQKGNEFSRQRPFKVLIHDENGIFVGGTTVNLRYEDSEDWDKIKKMIFAENPKWEDRCDRIEGFFIDKKDKIAR